MSLRSHALLALSLGLSALIGCAPQDQPGARAPSEAGCGAAPATALLALSSDAGEDVAEARAIGPTCEEAAVVLTIRAADGRLLLTFAAPYRQMITETAPGARVAVEDMQAFLQGWAEATVGTSATNTPWPAGQEGLSPPDGPALFSTALPRAVYEQFRAENLRQACVATGFEAFACYGYLPETRSVIALVRTGA